MNHQPFAYKTLLTITPAKKTSNFFFPKEIARPKPKLWALIEGAKSYYFVGIILVVREVERLSTWFRSHLYTVLVKYGSQSFGGSN